MWCGKLGLFPSPLWGGARGGGRSYCALNDLKHAICVREYVVIPEAKNAIALDFEKYCSLRVDDGSFVMLPTIHLDDEAGVMASKVHDVWPSLTCRRK